MKKVSQQLDDKLLEYLDGKLSPAEQEYLEKEISASAEVRTRLDELQNLTRAIKSVQVVQPSRNFTQRVMDHLDQYPVRSGLSARNGIFLLAGVLIAVGLGSFLLASGIFDTPGTIDLNAFGLQNKYLKEPLPSIPFNGKLVVNIIIMLNIALAFLILDRVILRPWFENRARMS
jgi:hypothetical protein